MDHHEKLKIVKVWTIRLFQSFRFFHHPIRTLLQFTDYLFWNALSSLDVTFDRNYLFFCRTTFKLYQHSSYIRTFSKKFLSDSWNRFDDRETTKRINHFHGMGKNMKTITEASQDRGTYTYVTVTLGRERKNGPGSFLNGSRVYSGKMERYFLSSICVLKICKLMEDILNMPHNIVRASVNLRSVLPRMKSFRYECEMFPINGRPIAPLGIIRTTLIINIRNIHWRYIYQTIDF